MTEREAALESELKAERIKVDLLEQKVDALVRMLYGSKSEKPDPNQLIFEGERQKGSEYQEKKSFFSDLCKWHEYSYPAHMGRFSSDEKMSVSDGVVRVVGFPLYGNSGP